MKHLLFTTTILMISIFSSNAQTIGFIQVPPLSPAPHLIADFNEVDYSASAIADVDGDNDLDIYITGEASEQIAKLYINDGSGNYTEATGTPFMPVSYGAVAFADIDGDNDQDLLIAGENYDEGYISILYRNDGSGNFAEISGTSFPEIVYGSVTFADIDGDTDQDLLFTGEGNTNLFTNDGSGNFTEDLSASFEGVEHSSSAFADIDGDNDLDVLIIGGSTERTAKLYTNNGSGAFTEKTGTPFIGVDNGSIAFADVDGDNDQDVVVSGETDAIEYTTTLYINDGSGNYTIDVTSSFEGINEGRIAFIDINNDNDKDLIISGRSNSGPTTKLYDNNGEGLFTENTESSFAPISEGSISVADIDNDSDMDVLLTGENTASIYVNDGNGIFLEATGTPFHKVGRSYIAFSDIDGDQDNDVMISGYSNSGTITKLYSNDGNGYFTAVNDASFPNVHTGSISFADIDNDDDQDLLLTGNDPSNNPVTKLYTNDGTGNFSEVAGTPFFEASYSASAFADVDGDNDMDLLLTGSNSRLAKLYTNDGMGNFTEVLYTPFEGVYKGRIKFVDVDGDNDLDLFIIGRDDSNHGTAILYTNDGTGDYTEVTGTPFTGVGEGSMDFADIDGDNDMDLLITGSLNNGSPSTELYTNDGSGNFYLVNDAPFEPLGHGTSIAFADIDNDNDQDVLLTGNNSSYKKAYLFTNDGEGNFTEVYGMPLTGVSEGFVAFNDVDNDNYLDVVITGKAESGRIAKIYRNTTCYPNTGTDIQVACDSFTWIDGNTYTEKQ
jgi:hypothetical protein